MLENASTVAQVEAIGNIEFGGNGKTFAENYPTEYNDVELLLSVRVIPLIEQILLEPKMIKEKRTII